MQFNVVDDEESVVEVVGVGAGEALVLPIELRDFGRCRLAAIKSVKHRVDPLVCFELLQFNRADAARRITPYASFPTPFILFLLLYFEYADEEAGKLPVLHCIMLWFMNFTCLQYSRFHVAQRHFAH